MLEFNRNDVIKALYLNSNQSRENGNEILYININGLIDSMGELCPDFYDLFCVDGQNIDDKINLLKANLAGICIINSVEFEHIIVEMLDMDLEEPCIASMSNSLMPIIDDCGGFVPYLVILEQLMTITWFNSQRFTDYDYISSLIYAMDCDYSLWDIWYNSEGDILYQFVQIDR